MQSLINLANEIPWIMAPTALTAAIALISAIVLIMRYAESFTKIAMLWTVFNLTLAAIVMRIFY